MIRSLYVLCAASLSREIHHSENAWVLNWTCQYDSGDAHLLIKLGEEEQYRLGKELRASYPALFSRPYTSNRYQFVHTLVPRAGQRYVSKANP
jgi:hypothetical protein